MSSHNCTLCLTQSATKPSHLVNKAILQSLEAIGELKGRILPLDSYICCNHFPAHSASYCSRQKSCVRHEVGPQQVDTVKRSPRKKRTHPEAFKEESLPPTTETPSHPASILKGPIAWFQNVFNGIIPSQSNSNTSSSSSNAELKTLESPSKRTAPLQNAVISVTKGPSNPPKNARDQQIEALEQEIAHHKNEAQHFKSLYEATTADLNKVKRRNDQLTTEKKSFTTNLLAKSCFLHLWDQQIALQKLFQEAGPNTVEEKQYKNFLYDWTLESDADAIIAKWDKEIEHYPPQGNDPFTRPQWFFLFLIYHGKEWPPAAIQSFSGVAALTTMYHFGKIRRYLVASKTKR